MIRLLAQAEHHLTEASLSASVCRTLGKLTETSAGFLGATTCCGGKVGIRSYGSLREEGPVSRTRGTLNQVTYRVGTKGLVNSLSLGAWGTGSPGTVVLDERAVERRT